jgi:hypothetical protein
MKRYQVPRMLLRSTNGAMLSIPPPQFQNETLKLYAGNHHA